MSQASHVVALEGRTRAAAPLRARILPARGALTLDEALLILPSSQPLSTVGEIDAVHSQMAELSAAEGRAKDGALLDDARSMLRARLLHKHRSAPFTVLRALMTAVALILSLLLLLRAIEYVDGLDALATTSAEHEAVHTFAAWMGALAVIAPVGIVWRAWSPRHVPWLAMAVVIVGMIAQLVVMLPLIVLGRMPEISGTGGFSSFALGILAAASGLIAIVQTRRDEAKERGKQ